MDYRTLAMEYAKKNGLDPRLFTAQIKAESNWNPKAVSPVGAQGLGQVMPDTARQPGFGVSPLSDPWDPNENLRFSSEYMSKMLNRYNGDHRRALAAYNWGAGNADKWDGNLNSLPEETRNYITKIEQSMAEGPGALSGGRGPEDGDGIGINPVMLSTQGALAQANPNAITQFPVAGPEPVSVTSLATGQKPFPEVLADLERQGLRDDQAPIESIGISPEEAYALDNPMPALAGGGVTAGQVGTDAIASSRGPSTQAPEEFEPRGSFKDFFGLGNAEGGGAISRWLGWDQMTADQRDDRWLAIGAGLLSGDDWASGIGNAAKNVMGVNQNDRDNQFRQQQLAMQEARLSQSSDRAYNLPMNVVGRDLETGQEVVLAGTMINGVPHITGEDGTPVPATTRLRDVRIGSRSDQQNVTMGAGGIPNADFVSGEGVPSFTFQRESQEKNYGYAIRAIGAFKDLDNIWTTMGPEQVTALRTGLETWAANNANGRVTGAVLNTIIGNSGLSGAAANTARAFLQSILRADTGAAYTGAEIADYAGAFLPAPGDDPQDVEQKRRLMQRELYRFIGTTGAASPYLAGVLEGTYDLPGGYWQGPAPSGGGALDSSNGGQTQGDPEVEEYLRQRGI
jgi:hypothetical protein